MNSKPESQARLGHPHGTEVPDVLQFRDHRNHPPYPSSRGVEMTDSIVVPIDGHTEPAAGAAGTGHRRKAVEVDR